MPEIMSPTEFRDLLERNSLRQVDAAWICGVGIRQARSWALGEYEIPQYACLLLRAYDQGMITPHWLAANVTKEPPP
jgi:hypothetical protein